MKIVHIYCARCMTDFWTKSSSLINTLPLHGKFVGDCSSMPSTSPASCRKVTYDVEMQLKTQ